MFHHPLFNVLQLFLIKLLVNIIRNHRGSESRLSQFLNYFVVCSEPFNTLQSVFLYCNKRGRDEALFTMYLPSENTDSECLELVKCVNLTRMYLNLWLLIACLG